MTPPRKIATKKGSAAIGWILVMVLALSIIGFTYPQIRESFSDTSGRVAEEIDNTMDTIDEQIIYHPDID